MNKILETSFNGQLILKKNYPECVSLVFWKKLQLNYFVSRSTDLQDLSANQHSQSSPFSQIMAGLAVLHIWQILKGSQQCTTITRFWYREPKLKSKILSSETETFSFNKFFSCFPLLSWGYEFLKVGMSKMASTLCSNFFALFSDSLGGVRKNALFPQFTAFTKKCSNLYKSQDLYNLSVQVAT